jgi:hypothetical protein
MDSLAADIDPEERFTAFIVDRALADDVLSVEYKRRRHAALPALRPTYPTQPVS